MAEMVDFPERTMERYPFDEWFDGHAWELTRGKDFRVNCDSMRRCVLLAAQRRGVKVRTSLGQDGTTIIVQLVAESERQSA